MQVNFSTTCGRFERVTLAHENCVGLLAPPKVSFAFAAVALPMYTSTLIFCPPVVLLAVNTPPLVVKPLTAASELAMMYGEQNQLPGRFTHVDCAAQWLTSAPCAHSFTSAQPVLPLIW